MLIGKLPIGKLLIRTLRAIEVYKRIVALPIGETADREIADREIAYKGKLHIVKTLIPETLTLILEEERNVHFISIYYTNNLQFASPPTWKAANV